MVTSSSAVCPPSTRSTIRFEDRTLNCARVVISRANSYGLLLQLLGRDQFVDQPQAQGVLGVHVLAGEQDPLRP